MLVSIAAGIVSAFALFSARTSMLRGAAELDRAQLSMRVLTGTGSGRAGIDDIRTHVTAARSHFDAAALRLGPFSLLLPHLSWVPGVGDQLAAAPALADAGKYASAGILELLRGLDPLVRAFPGGAGTRHVTTPTLLADLNLGHGDFRSACSLLGKAAVSRAAVHSARSFALVNALHTFDARLPGLRVLCRFLQVAPASFGYPRPRTYLLAYQDPLELRATGGFIGSAGIIRVSNGVVRQTFADTGSFQHENFTVPSPEPVHLYNIEPFWLFRDANWSPDFPTSAALERYFLRLDAKQTVSGVINITPAAAAALLDATGPVPLAEYGVTVTSANVAQLADFYTHWSPVQGPVKKGGRKQFIAILGGHLFSRLERLSLTSWLHLGEALSGIVPRGDLLMNSTIPREQAIIQAAGAGGGVSRRNGDYLYVVDSNLSYNKINPFIRETVSYSAHVGADGWLSSTLTLRYQNQTPVSQAVQGIGPGAGRFGGPLDYADFIRVYVPDGSDLIDQTGWTQPWAPGPAYGRAMFSGYLIVPVNRTRTVRLHYVVPPNVMSWSGGSRYRLSIQHQPGSTPDLWRVAVRDNAAHALMWEVRTPDRDMHLGMAVKVQSLHPIPLQREPTTVVAPGHWIEPHAYLGTPGK